MSFKHFSPKRSDCEDRQMKKYEMNFIVSPEFFRFHEYCYGCTLSVGITKKIEHPLSSN